MVRQRLEVLRDGGEMEFVACAGKTSQTHPLEAAMGLQVREAHLDALSFIARFEEGLRPHQPTRQITCLLMKIAWDLSSRHVGTALRFQWTDVAVELGGAVEQRPAVMHSACGAQKLAVGADVNIPSFLPTEVRARESAICSFALVSNRNVRRDPAPDEPAKKATGPIGGVGQ